MAAPFDVKAIPPGAELELFISPACPYCVAAMEHYDRAGTRYRTRDAQNDPRSREEMLAHTAGDPTVPAIVVDGRYVQSGWGTPPRG